MTEWKKLNCKLFKKLISKHKVVIMSWLIE